MYRPFSVKRNYNNDTNTYDGELTIVESHSGCWRVTSTSPKGLYEQGLVGQIEQILSVLSAELLSNLL